MEVTISKSCILIGERSRGKCFLSHKVYKSNWLREARHCNDLESRRDKTTRKEFGRESVGQRAMNIRRWGMYYSDESSAPNQNCSAKGRAHFRSQLGCGQSQRDDQNPPKRSSRAKPDLAQVQAILLMLQKCDDKEGTKLGNQLGARSTTRGIRMNPFQVTQFSSPLRWSFASIGNPVKQKMRWTNFTGESHTLQILRYGIGKVPTSNSQAFIV